MTETEHQIKRRVGRPSKLATLDVSCLDWNKSNKAIGKQLDISSHSVPKLRAMHGQSESPCGRPAIHREFAVGDRVQKRWWRTEAGLVGIIQAIHDDTALVEWQGKPGPRRITGVKLVNLKVVNDD